MLMRQTSVSECTDREAEVQGGEKACLRSHKEYLDRELVTSDSSFFTVLSAY